MLWKPVPFFFLLEKEENAFPVIELDRKQFMVGDKIEMKCEVAISKGGQINMGWQLPFEKVCILFL